MLRAIVRCRVRQVLTDGALGLRLRGVRLAAQAGALSIPCIPCIPCIPSNIRRRAKGERSGRKWGAGHGLRKGEGKLGVLSASLPLWAQQDP
eukprot:1191177-Prorocentrum_minimum.AAC.2